LAGAAERRAARRCPLWKDTIAASNFANRQNDPNCHKSGKFDTLPLIIERNMSFVALIATGGFDADDNAITVSHRG
jgi:hypothetical protein